MSQNPRGFGDSGWLREAFLQVPREHFVPDRVWWPEPGEDGLHSLLSREERPRAWLKAIYMPGVPLITQLDDGAVPPEGRAKGAFTSSISSAGVIIELLHHLAPQPGDRVLEIGTGTGYTTALLASRVGAEGAVATVEIDADLATRARERLTTLGLPPLVVTGDGEDGYAADSPYDRIVATASVRRIPPAWLEQLCPGGVLVAPLDSPFGCDLLVHLEGDGRGAARGRVLERVEFMQVRGQREKRSYDDLGWPVEVDPESWRDLHIVVGPEGQRISQP
ncbi:protein-L-isoaspartate(D-aspartate) O-methyltransferase [Streptomyces nanshensis]|uniref:Protein-L-isoaspartate O-methyltransferase n=2 Tax=Streptomyces nanshensis TaxID=518642 RepID=A0A1E7L609_9ACTN|nr:protein-L-isoaspartate(D-aspartate) O-methyltransferase [Streptomyces nanshensis]